MPFKSKRWEAAVIGGGIAGLSAAIYLGRAQRDAIVIDTGTSLAQWEPEVQNFLGFPDGISGVELLKRGRSQARRYGLTLVKDEIIQVRRKGREFVLKGRKEVYLASRLLLATGLYHLPPEIPNVKKCLGHSMFFCKDCDGHRVRGKRIAIMGHNNEAVEYALGMLLFSSCVIIATNGHKPAWDRRHSRWLKEYQIPLQLDRVVEVLCQGCQVRGLRFADRSEFALDAIFTTRGDVYYNRLGSALGVRLGVEGEILVNDCRRTSVPGVYAAGCVTSANCQMIIAAGDGATAAQAINRDLFEESLRTRTLRLYRQDQLRQKKTVPERTRRRSAGSAFPKKFNLRVQALDRRSEGPNS